MGFLRDHESHERNRREEVTTLFNRYVSPQVVDRILEKDVSFEGRSTEASVLFSDIRGFTAFAENQAPAKLLAALNLHFGAMVEVILSRSGYIDKFIGGAVMAVFGVPFTAGDDAERAVLAAINMQHALRKLNTEEAFGSTALNMGIGIHTGRLVAGNVGSSERMQYTVIGDAVNLASRIESLNKVYGTHLLISDSTYRAVRHNSELLLREVDLVRVKGRQTPVVLYEVCNCCTADEIRSKNESLGDFMAAMVSYKNANWDECEAALRRALDAYPGDRISRLHLERTATLRLRTPENWDGVFDLTLK